MYIYFNDGIKNAMCDVTLNSSSARNLLKYRVLISTVDE